MKDEYTAEELVAFLDKADKAAEAFKKIDPRKPIEAKKPVVLIATPSFEGRPCIEYLSALTETKHLLNENKIDHIFSILPGDPYLGKVRSRIASQVLTDFPMVTDLFFIDDDVGWPPHKVVEFLNRPQDVILGVYPKKLDVPEWPADLMSEDGKAIVKDGLFLARLVPTGFMRIKRHVIEKLAQVSPRHMEPQPGGQVKIIWDIFYAGYVDLAIEKLRKTDLSKFTREEAIAWLKRAIGVVTTNEVGEYWGEDYYFAQRWREMGGEFWIDPDINFTHRGSKAWSGNFAVATKDVPR